MPVPLPEICPGERVLKANGGETATELASALPVGLINIGDPRPTGGYVDQQAALRVDEFDQVLKDSALSCFLGFVGTPGLARGVDAVRVKPDCLSPVHQRRNSASGT